MIVKTILHYKILEKLGEGGMGVVYLAEDTKLERKVAIKFLPRNIAADSDQRERFKIEAKAAASLNHPNIATIHYIEEVDDETFIVMEYIEGFELKDKIRQGSLPLPEAVDITMKIGAGLQAAHEKDIVHRDIKSSNIMLAKNGRVKVMDFGLAKVRGVANVTKEGTTLGTITYMSPEQAGGSEVDHRSDIWSLGVLLYEMVSGKLPFQGSYDQAVIYSILNDEPRTLQEHPEALQKILHRALAKNPAERYQQVSELLADLQSLSINENSGSRPVVQSQSRKFRLPVWLSFTLVGITGIILFIMFGLPALTDRGAPPLDDKSIAVIPFKNLSSDAGTDYFSEGITEDIITQLSNISELKVIARSSVDRFKDRGLTSSEIGMQLNVASILEGSIRRGGDRVRIVSRLIDVRSEENIWAETYDRELEDIFEIQTDVSRRIAAALQAQLSPREEKRLEKRPTENLDAYNLYLQGRYHWRKRTGQELLKAAEDFEQAISMDGLFALAYVGLADCYALFQYYGVTKFPRDKAFSEAEKMARKALELEPDLAAAHASLGNVLKEGKWDWQGAEQEFRTAIALNPKDANAHQWYSELLLTMDRKEEALKMAQIAYNLEPYALVISNNLGRALMFLNRYEEARDQLLKTLELDPMFAAAHNNLGWTYIFMNQFQKAEEEFSLWGELNKIEDLFVHVLLNPNNKSDLTQIEQLLETEKDITRRYKNRSHAPLVFGMLGEKQKALKWLKKSYTGRLPEFIYNLGHPALDRYKYEPEFVEFYRSIGLKN